MKVESEILNFKKTSFFVTLIRFPLSKNIAATRNSVATSQKSHALEKHDSLYVVPKKISVALGVSLTPVMKIFVPKNWYLANAAWLTNLLKS